MTSSEAYFAPQHPDGTQDAEPADVPPPGRASLPAAAASDGTQAQPDTGSGSEDQPQNAREDTDMPRNLDELRARALAELRAHCDETILLDPEIGLAYCEHGVLLWLDVEEGDGPAWAAFVKASEAGTLPSEEPGWTLTSEAREAEKVARPW